MNRYIITKIQMKGQEYMISALYDEKKKMIEAIPEPADKSSILGNIYIGRVQNIVQNINAAFIQIAPDQTCYFSLEDLENPIFTKKITSQKALTAGDELLVQVCREALKTKEPAVTSNISLSGKYAVLTTGNMRYSVSSKLTKTQREHYRSLLDKFQAQCCAANGPEYGIIIRTNAADMDDDTVLKELHALNERYQRMKETVKHRICYSCIYQEPNACIKQVDHLLYDTLEEIITDQRDYFDELCRHFDLAEAESVNALVLKEPEVETKEHIKIRYYQDEMLPLPSLYSVKTHLEEALKERVWLRSGAYLIIQPTEALTVIDVNTGKNTAKKNVQENFLRVNKEAAAEIARQLRLRNISGIIVVDFINLEEESAREELMTEFRKLLKQDPVPAQLIDITKLGLVELTRKKVRKSLWESMYQKN